MWVSCARVRASAPLKTATVPQPGAELQRQRPADGVPIPPGPHRPEPKGDHRCPRRVWGPKRRGCVRPFPGHSIAVNLALGTPHPMWRTTRRFPQGIMMLFIAFNSTILLERMARAFNLKCAKKKRSAGGFGTPQVVGERLRCEDKSGRPLLGNNWHQEA